MAKFKYLNDRERHSQSFDKEKISITKAGKTYNVYDFIQEGRDDTEIYPTLEKYGCIDKLKMDTQEVYNNFSKLSDMRDIIEQKKEADLIWENLPLEVRSEFGNNQQEFLRDGEKWLKSKLIEQSIQNDNDINQNNNQENIENNINHDTPQTN